MLEFQHDHEQLSTLLEVMDAAQGAPDQRTVATQVLDRLIERSIIAAGGIWLRDDRELIRLAQRNLAQPIPRATLTRAMATGVPVYSPEENQGAEPAQHVTILPLTGMAECTGVLVVVTPEPLVPSHDLLLRAVTLHLGIAIERAQLRARDQAGSSEGQWEEFLAHAAHEIKNPLASIKGYADLLLRRAAQDPADPYRKGLTIISDQVARTTALLEQLSDISRISTDHLRIEQRDADLASIVDHAIQNYQSMTDLHQLSLHIGGRSLRGRFDEIRLSQAVGAMVSNAIKFAPNGGPVTVRLQPLNESVTPTAILSVSDMGVGVPAGEEERVFERFFRGSNIRGSFSGLGVGLYIARAIIRLHGGQIWLESQRGLGTTCYAKLPLADVIPRNPVSA